MTAPTTPWAQANQDAMQNMQQAMMNASGGATSEDEAFVRGMLPHHSGAVDHGARRTPITAATRSSSASPPGSSATQQMEIREMSGWLARHH